MLSIRGKGGAGDPPRGSLSDAEYEQLLALQRRSEGMTDAQAATKRSIAAPRWPWTTIAVCVVWIVLWLVMRARGDGVVTVEVVRAFGGVENALVREGEWWRLLVAGFLHVQFIDLLFNIWFFFTAGRMVEALLGRSTLLAVFLLSGLAGGLATVLGDGGSQLLSTGATFGTIAGMMAIYFRYRRLIPRMMRGAFLGFVPLIVIYVILIASGYAVMDLHELLGGMVGGGLAVYLLPARGGFARNVLGAGPGPLRWLQPALVATALLLGVVFAVRSATGAAGAGAGERYEHPRDGWSVVLPAGYKGEVKERLVEFRHFVHEARFRVMLSRELVAAKLPQIERHFSESYGIGAHNKEQLLEKIPIGDATFVLLRAENRDSTRVMEFLASEASVRTRGLFFAGEAPIDELSRLHDGLMRMAETYETRNN